MNPEGRLEIRLLAGSPPAIRSTRPFQLTRLFRGKSPAQLLTTLPLLYRVCGTAQAAAAVAACEQALGIRTDPATQRARALLVSVETLREHLWRILIDAPGLRGVPLAPSEQAKAMAALPRLLPEARNALFGAAEPFAVGAVSRPDAAALAALANGIADLLAERLFGETPTVWLKLCSADALRLWIERRATPAAAMLAEVARMGWSRLGAIEPNLLPDLSPSRLNARLAGTAADRFVALPDWSDTPGSPPLARETSALGRHWQTPLVAAARTAWGCGLTTRWLARLTEMARIAVDLTQGIDPGTPTRIPEADEALPAGVGLAQVEAARGRLIHRVVLEGGAVADYRIVAPTEWNFHPRGSAATALATLEHDDPERLRRQAGLLIGAIDPCVGYELIVGEQPESPRPA